MRCVNCQGELGSVFLQTDGGARLKARRCLSCGGFWFSNKQVEEVSSVSAHQFDSPSPSYSLSEHNFICPLDRSLMTEIRAVASEATGRLWRCPECDAVFVPRGQLALLTDWRHSQHLENREAGRIGRTQLTEVALLLGLGGYLVFLGGRRNSSPFLASGEPLSDTTPVILPLLLLAITYLSGIILAILGRKLPIIIMGWGVIVVCIFGFVVLAAGP